MTQFKDSTNYLAAVAKYVETGQGKWENIALANKADKVPLGEITELAAAVRGNEVTRRQARFAKLKELDAPECIVDNEKELLARATAGKSNAEAALHRSYRRRTKV